MTIEWHPDRNPDCPQCLKKFQVCTIFYLSAKKCVGYLFQEISHAYATLANKESREIYDKSSSSFTAIDSSAISLTSENFDEWVSTIPSEKINYFFFLLGLSPIRWATKFGWSRHTQISMGCVVMLLLHGRMQVIGIDVMLWFDVFFWSVIHLGKSVGFARINARTTKKLVSRLPVKVRIYPTIIMLSESQPVEVRIVSMRFVFSASIVNSKYHPPRHTRIFIKCLRRTFEVG